MGDHRTDHQGKTRSLRPIDSITFTTQEMMTGILASISPSSILSINQLHGDRKGVVRLTCKSQDAAKELDTRVASRRVQINGVRLAAVSETGHFVKLTMMDVPQYLSSDDIERELSIYGNVVNVRREYVEYQGYRLENETRHILLTSLVRDIPSRISVDGNEVFVSGRPIMAQRDSTKSRQGSQGLEPEPFISQPNYIPKHVMSSVYNSTTENLRRGQPHIEAAENGNASDKEQEGSGDNIHLKPRRRPGGSTSPSPNLTRKLTGGIIIESKPLSLNEAADRLTIKEVDKPQQKERECQVKEAHFSEATNYSPKGRRSSEEDRRSRSRPSHLLTGETGCDYTRQSRGVERRRSFDCDREHDVSHERYARSKTPDGESHI